MSTDDDGREPDDLEPTATPDAAGAAPSAPATEAVVGPDDAASDDTRADLADIESKPLAERAPGYQALADRLRAELEQSDPSRGSS